MLDLLYLACGRRHETTRPPRLSFPRSAGYALRHKYPQRLDYLFFRPGDIGTSTSIISETEVCRFEAWPHTPATVSSSSSSFATDTAADPTTRSQSYSRTNVGTRTRVSNTRRRFWPWQWQWQWGHNTQPAYEYLSDHFGIATTFRVADEIQVCAL